MDCEPQHKNEGRGHQNTVEPVKHATVARHDIAAVFDTATAFEHRLHKVAKGAEYTTYNANNSPA